MKRSKLQLLSYITALGMMNSGPFHSEWDRMDHSVYDRGDDSHNPNKVIAKKFYYINSKRQMQSQRVKMTLEQYWELASRCDGTVKFEQLLADQFKKGSIVKHTLEEIR